MLIQQEQAQRSVKTKVQTKGEYVDVEQSKILDGMQLPLKANMIKVKGTYFQKTHQGYFKMSHIILKNSELYFYDDHHNMNLQQVLILSPQVFVLKQAEVTPYQEKEKGEQG